MTSALITALCVEGSCHTMTKDEIIIELDQLLESFNKIQLQSEPEYVIVDTNALFYKAIKLIMRIRNEGIEDEEE